MKYGVSDIVLQNRKIRLDEETHVPALDDKARYQHLLKKWQKKLLHVQQAYFHQGRRAIVVFERFGQRRGYSPADRKARPSWLCGASHRNPHGR